MEKLKNRWQKIEEEKREREIQSLLFSIDYHLMALHMALEKKDEKEVRSSKEEIRYLRDQLVSYGFYGNKSTKT